MERELDWSGNKKKEDVSDVGGIARAKGLPVLGSSLYTKNI
jgi:hypothetical protein